LSSPEVRRHAVPDAADAESKSPGTEIGYVSDPQTEKVKEK
jgi:hypothetical protein